MLLKYDVESNQPSHNFVDGPHIRVLKYEKCLEVLYFNYDFNKALLSVDSDKISIDENVEVEVEINHEKYIPKFNAKLFHSAPASVFSAVEKIVAIGDLHGDYNRLIRALLAANVINKQGSWIFGNGHVVIIGDVFDRGNQVTSLLWKIYQLNQESERAGGKVHFLLGNHEWMNLNKDHRFLHPHYVYLCEKHNIDYSDLYNSDFILGSWLRSRNSVIRIGDVLFVHAGLSAEVSEAFPYLEDINIQIRRILDDSLIVRRNSKEELLTGSYGPLWYRGYIMPWVGKSIVNTSDFKKILKVYNSNYLVFGHTTQAHIESFYDGAAFGIDVPFGNIEQEEVLLYEDGVWYRFYVHKKEKVKIG
ncbi:MAG: metallophosphoesterase [Bacteroidales bacterium]